MKAFQAPAKVSTSKWNSPPLCSGISGWLSGLSVIVSITLFDEAAVWESREHQNMYMLFYLELLRCKLLPVKDIVYEYNIVRYVTW